MAWEDDDDRPDSFEPLPPQESRTWRHPAEHAAGGGDAAVMSHRRSDAVAAICLAAGTPMIATALVHLRLRPALGLVAVVVGIGQLASGLLLLGRCPHAWALVVPVQTAALATLAALFVVGDRSVLRPGGIDFVAAVLTGLALLATWPGAGRRPEPRVTGARPVYARLAALGAPLALVAAVPH